MTARRSKSRKGSGANSPSQPRRDLQPTFFLDKCLGRNDVANALRAVGATIELLTDHFAPDAPDQDWLPVVGRNGWVILTKDRSLLTNPLEVKALIESNAPSFVLRAADMTGAEMGAAFAAAYPTMLKFLRKFQPPFLAQVTRQGHVSTLVTYDDLLRRLR